MTQIKQCRSCGRVLPLTEYGINRAKSDGYQIYCKECTNIKIREYRDSVRRRERLKMQKDWKGNTNSVFKIIGASNHADHEREKRDYYATEPKAAELLLEIEHFAPHILEPCCGAGHLANVLKDAGYQVECNDIIDRGCNDTTGDYLARTEEWQGDIITNPPYSKAQEFVEKSLSLVSDGSKVAMFLKLTFLEGKKRRTLYEEHPPRRIWVSSSRLKCAINGDFDNTGTSATAYAWFVWEKGYKGSPEIRWFN